MPFVYPLHKINIDNYNGKVHKVSQNWAFELWESIHALYLKIENLKYNDDEKLPCPLNMFPENQTVATPYTLEPKL